MGLPKRIDEGGRQRGVLVVGGGRQDYGLDLSCCDIVQSRDNMITLGQVYCDYRIGGLELSFHLAEPHLRPRGPEWRQFDGDG